MMAVKCKGPKGVRRLTTVNLEPLEVPQPIMIYDPHGDDFALAGGGLLWALASLGKKIAIDVISDGRHGNSVAEETATIVQTRKLEIIEGYGTLGVLKDNILFSEYPDSGLKIYLDANTFEWRKPKTGLYAKIIRDLRKYAPKTIFIPQEDDWHEDHKDVFRASSYAIRQAQNPNAFGDFGEAVAIERVFVYGVWNELFRATHAFELGPEAREIKRRALRTFRTQETVINKLAPGTGTLESFREMPELVMKF